MHHCSTKWGVFLMSLKSLVETGKGAPDPNDVKLDNWNKGHQCSPGSIAGDIPCPYLGMTIGCEDDNPPSTAMACPFT